MILSQTSRGDVGEIGTIDVDVETGQLHVTPQLIAEMNTHAQRLVLSTASSSATGRRLPSRLRGRDLSPFKAQGRV